MGKEWIKNLLEELIQKKTSYSYASDYYNYQLSRNKIKPTSKKIELDYTTYSNNSKLIQEGGDFDKCESCSKFFDKKQQVGGFDDDDIVDDYDTYNVTDDEKEVDKEETKEEETKVKETSEEEEEEKPITEEQLEEAVEEDFDLDELTKLYSTQDIESEKLVKETSKLISEAVHDKKWEKATQNLTDEYDDSLDTLNIETK